MKRTITILLLTISLITRAQQSYTDSLQSFRRDYIDKHEVVKGSDRDSLRFFPIDISYRVNARFEPATDSKWFSMETSGTRKQTYRMYGMLHFTIHDTAIALPVYQSQSLLLVEKYRDYLFLPFTDRSSGESTYASGRYIDLLTTDIAGNRVVIDFNKAYNPYCAYVSGKYNCPIPPAANQLMVTIWAGEKNYAKTMH